MSSAEASERSYQLGSPSRGMLGLSGTEIGVLVVGLLLGLLWVLRADGFWARAGGFVAFAGVAAALLAPVRGHSLVHWLPRMAQSRARRAAGEGRYRSGSHEAGWLADGTAVEVDPPPAVGSMQWVTFPWDDDAVLCVLLHADASMTAALEVEGPGLGLYDTEARQAVHDQWSRLTDALANSPGHIDRVVQVVRTVPLGTDTHAGYVAAHGDPDCPPELAASYDALGGLVSAEAASHHVFLVLRMGSTPLRGKAARVNGGGLDGLVGLFVNEIRRVVLPHLDRAGLAVVRVLDEPALAAVIRNMVSPDRPLGDVGLRARDAWPRQAEAHPEFWWADGWCHATAAVVLPDRPVAVDFLDDLVVNAEVVKTLAVVQELVPSRVALRRVRRTVTAAEADQDREAGRNKTADPRHGKRVGAGQIQADDMADGDGGSLHALYLTVSGADETELADAKAHVAQLLPAGVDLDWLNYEHDRAVVNTLPFGHGLRSARWKLW